MMNVMLLAKLYGGIEWHRNYTVVYCTWTSSPGTESMSCLGGQDFLGKSVHLDIFSCWTDYPSAL